MMKIAALWQMTDLKFLIFFSNGTTSPPVVTTVKIKTIATTEPAPASAEEEHEKSMEIFFILLVVGNPWQSIVSPSSLITSSRNIYLRCVMFRLYLVFFFSRAVYFCDLLPYQTSLSLPTRKCCCCLLRYNYSILFAKTYYVYWYQVRQINHSLSY